VQAPSLSVSLARTLGASRIFRGVDAGALATIAASAARRRLARGDALWRAGDRAKSFHVIASGLIKITRRSRLGTSAILGIFGAHESIGDVPVLEGGAYVADAVAATDRADVVVLDAAAVLDGVARDASLARALNRSLVEHFRAMEAKVLVMSAGCVKCRLATLLVHLSERFGDELEDGTWRVPVTLSRKDLAELIGATTETTIRTMSEWQKRGIVATGDGGFVIHRPQQLYALAG
jgi:CRP-like cAMP-binding protein